MPGRILVGLSGLLLSSVACGGPTLLAPPVSSPPPTSEASLASSTALPAATLTPILFPTHTATVPPSQTPLPTSTSTPSLTPEPPWILQGPGEVIVPILLYHHIGVPVQADAAYYVSPEEFDRQMNLLYQWGYQTIPVELLTRAIEQGAKLPQKPVILTFDDGSQTTYSTALPILQRYGFSGAAYVVYNYVGTVNYMSADQVRALAAAGWEIGSHGLSHTDLTARPDRQKAEVVDSRRKLEALLGLPVLSFAYPFGAYDSDSLHYVHLAGYMAAMGLGNSTVQGSKNLFYLYRQPVRGTDTLQAFARLLPWQGGQIDLPAVTIVP